MKVTKKIIFHFSLLILYLINNTLALNINNISLGNVSLMSEHTHTEELDNEIKKQEIFSINTLGYPNWLQMSNEKYITVHILITYFNNLNNDTLATASITSNFRYNYKTKHAYCLSATVGSFCNTTNCDISTFTHKNNSNFEIGASDSEVKFKYKGKIHDEKKYTIYCDYMGNINS